MSTKIILQSYLKHKLVGLINWNVHIVYLYIYKGLRTYLGRQARQAALRLSAGTVLSSRPSIGEGARERPLNVRSTNGLEIRRM